MYIYDISISYNFMNNEKVLIYKNNIFYNFVEQSQSSEEQTMLKDLKLAVPVFHAYGHQASCQVVI